MTRTAEASVASHIVKLAKAHGITVERDAMSRLATTITRLSGDVVELDGVERLLVNLKKKGVLTKTQTLELEGRYLREKRGSANQLSA